MNSRQPKGDRTTTSTRLHNVAITKNARTYHARAKHGERGMFEFDSLADAGMVRVVSHGEENVYFEFADDNGTTQAGFVKCL